MTKQHRRGAAGQQYALIVGLIAVLGILAVTSLGANVREMFARTSNTLGIVTNQAGATTGATSGGGGTGSNETPTFPFTTHTFTPCAATGRTGPVLLGCQNSYTQPEAAGWKNNSAAYSVSGGIQRWTVPLSGTYRILARGAQGGCSAGTPASVQADFALSQGTVLHLLPGQIGPCASNLGGGGGGSFAVAGGTVPLVVAGGGGGGGGGSYTSASLTVNAENPATAQNCGAGRGGLNGGGGGGGANYGSGGGGGYYTDGGGGGYNAYGQPGGSAGTQSTAGGNAGGSACTGSGGRSFLNGGLGGGATTGTLNCYNNGFPTANGGFGGGGTNAAGNASGGGGGGWSGGAGGHYRDSPCSTSHAGESTGGASYVGTGGANATLSLTGTGDGFITITKL